jgi:hypothetical protein
LKKACPSQKRSRAPCEGGVAGDDLHLGPDAREVIGVEGLLGEVVEKPFSITPMVT